VSDAGASAVAPDAGPASGTIDLHAHTTASDGTATPERFVAAAVAAGLAAIAVTDHDTVAAVEEVTRRAPPGLRIVPGVELSVHDDKGKEVHMLGLHLADIAFMDSALVSVREARRNRAVRIVERLNAAGVDLSFDAVLAESAGGAMGRPHVARALMKAGKVASLQEAFDRWLGAGRTAFVEKERLSIADGIGLIHKAGGIAVYAHPGYEGTRERIAPLVELGLDGVEVRHPSHGADDIKRLRNLVNGLGIVPSGGSDWHGAEGGPRTLGCMQVTHEWMERQLARVAARTPA
jgi:predicted metal-dependent phosphoesterase TrpH